MFGPDVVEITLRVGVVADSDHCQIQLEWSNPTTGDLLGVEARHHVSLAGSDDALAWYVKRMTEVCREYTGPF